MTLTLKQPPERVIARCDADLASIEADMAATQDHGETLALQARHHRIMVERARAIRALWSRGSVENALK